MKDTAFFVDLIFWLTACPPIEVPWTAVCPNPSFIPLFSYASNPCLCGFAFHEVVTLHISYWSKMASISLAELLSIIPALLSDAWVVAAVPMGLPLPATGVFIVKVLLLSICVCAQFTSSRWCLPLTSAECPVCSKMKRKRKKGDIWMTIWCLLFLSRSCRYQVISTLNQCAMEQLMNKVTSTSGNALSGLRFFMLLAWASSIASDFCSSVSLFLLKF